MLKRGDIHIRDPFVLPVIEERLYYLYGTTAADGFKGPWYGCDAFVSADLVEWQGPIAAFRPPAGFWATRDFWAPEVHRHAGRYFMFVSFNADGVCRGTQILAADSPRGPFVPHSDGPVTPRDWQCLDGTLFVDDDAVPWMVFCHEWVQVTDGEVCAMKLSRDLRAAAGEPVLLFRASEAPWVSRDRPTFITDGPFLHRTASGALLMLWSSRGPRGYAQGVARSTTGKLSGPWQHEPQPLFAENGGHGMIFRTFDGRLMLTLHAPNQVPSERAVFLPVREEGDRLVLSATGDD